MCIRDSFYNVTLRNFIAPATNRAQSAFVPLNDYIATVIGMIRDNVPFNTVLSGDILYVGNTSGAPPYSPSNNNHYQYLDTNGVDLKSALVATTQSANTGIPSAATAGVITTAVSYTHLDVYKRQLIISPSTGVMTGMSVPALGLSNHAL